MSNIAFIGDSTSALGWMSLGVDIFSIDDPAELKESLPEITNAGYAVVFITEPLYVAAAPDITRRAEELTPAMIPVPGAGESLGEGRRGIEKLIVAAVGARLAQGGARG